MPRLPSTKSKTRLNLDLSTSARKSLEDLRTATDADSLSEVIRRSLNVYNLVVCARDSNSVVIIRSNDGSERELVLT